MASFLSHNPYAKKIKTNEVESASHDNIAKSDSLETSAAPRCSPPNQPPLVPAAVSSSAAALVISATDKAGMEGIDRARIDAIILRESGDSLFMQQQRRRDLKVDERIQQLRQKLSVETKHNPDWKQKLEREIDRDIPNMLAKRRKRSSCVVVDMDMFYMACELLTRPELNDRPACVGGNMITTSNYVARKYGVRSAMAGWIGDKLVEELSGGRERLVHVPHNFDLYRAKSDIVRQVLAEYDPSLRAYSLDEVYLDLAPYMVYKLTEGWDHERIHEALASADLSQIELDDDANRVHANDDGEHETRPTVYGHEQLLQFPESLCRQTVAEILQDMRKRVTDATGGLTCSAGAAPNFLLAKVASDRNKPNGQLIVGSSHEDVKAFLYPLAARKVGGIGRVTDKILHAFSIATVAQLYEQRALIRLLFQPASASHLLHASIGCSSSDERAGENEDTGPSQKGISRERTFRAGKPWEEVLARLEDIGRLLSDDMKQKGFWARNICVKVKLHTFDCFNRSLTVPFGLYLQASDDIIKHAKELLEETREHFKGKEFSVRLLGIRCSAITTESEKKSNTGGLSLEHYFSKSPLPVKQPRGQSPAFHSEDGEPTTETKRNLQTEPLLARMTSSFHDENVSQPTLGRISIRSLTDAGPDANCATMEPSTLETVECPLCHKEFLADANDDLNQHIDSCLSGKSVRQVVKEWSNWEPTKRRKGSLDHFLKKEK